MLGYVRAQGWYRDPYYRHDERWVTQGRPTALVRDGGVESHDEAPHWLPALAESEWRPLHESLPQWLPQSATGPRLARHVGVALAIISAFVGQFAIWVLVHAGLVAWAFSQAWPPGGPGSG